MRVKIMRSAAACPLFSECTQQGASLSKDWCVSCQSTFTGCFVLAASLARALANMRDTVPFFQIIDTIEYILLRIPNFLF